MGNFELSEEEVKIFIEESRDQLQSLEMNLLQLESEPESQGLIQEIFRAAHTLKGGSATAGLEDMAQLTHVMESLLDHVRQGDWQLTSGLVDALLAGVDSLDQYMDALEAGEPTSEIDITACVNQLNSLSGQDEPSTGGQGLKPTGADHVLQQAAGDVPVYRIKIHINAGAPMPSVRAYQAMIVLDEAGECLSASPSLNSLENEVNIDVDVLEVLIQTRQDPGRILEELEVVPELDAVTYEQLDLAQSSAPPETGEPRTGGSKSPLGQNVRVDVETLDALMNLVGELVIDGTRLNQVIVAGETLEQLKDELKQVAGHLGRITTDLQDAIMQTRMIPVNTVFRKFPRMMRDLARDLGKPLNFEISGEQTELDRSVISEISDPIMHLLRNALDHGIEPAEVRVQKGKPTKGTIRLSAFHQENNIYIQVQDDGGGIDPQGVLAKAREKGLLSSEEANRLDRAGALELIFEPGFSTSEAVNPISGRGVGMDVVKRNVEKVGGVISLETTAGQGTVFTIKLPLTLAIVHSLMVDVAGTTFAIPITNVVETVQVQRSNTHLARGVRMINVRNEMVPLLNPASVWDDRYHVDWNQDRPNPVVVLQSGPASLGLMVSQLLGEQEVVIKSMGPLIGETLGVSGASIQGDGRVALIIDVTSLTRAVNQYARSG